MDRKALFIILLLFFMTNIGLACQCPTVSIDSAFKDSSIIFRGKVKQIVSDKFFNYQGASSTLVNFEVIEGYKRAKPGDGLISIINYGSSCDLHFEEGKEYYVFGYDLALGHFSADMCTETAAVEHFAQEKLSKLKELSGKYVDDLYNYQDLMVLNKTSYNALNNENIRLGRLVEEQKDQIKIMTYSFVAVLLALVIFFVLYQKKKKSSR